MTRYLSWIFHPCNSEPLSSITAPMYVVASKAFWFPIRMALLRVQTCWQAGQQLPKFCWCHGSWPSSKCNCVSYHARLATSHSLAYPLPPNTQMPMPETSSPRDYRPPSLSWQLQQLQTTMAVAKPMKAVSWLFPEWILEPSIGLWPTCLKARLRSLLIVLMLVWKFVFGCLLMYHGEMPPNRSSTAWEKEQSQARP